ncbi:MAG: MFS transporter, partial [Bacteroidia bacterium]|nr:MFS transporter [Bacteroidia bacterium]
MGQGLANVGVLIKQVALGWLVYRLTDSAILLGLVMFCREIAAFVTSPFAGVIADRLNKYQLLIVANLLLLANASLLGFLVINGYINLLWLVFIQIIFGCIGGAEIPTRQAFINDLVENKENLTNAIAFNSTLFNTARIVGPAIAGMLIPIIGEGFCFLLYAVLLAFILIIFGFIRYRADKKTMPEKNFRREMQEGIHYAYQSESIRTLLLLFASVTFFGISYEMLLPVFAEEIFQAGSQGYGYMTSAIGVGSVLGAIFIANRKDLFGLE